MLVPAFRDEQGEVRLVLVVRAAGGVHGGQIAFPGGKRDPGDASLLETALREAAEEVGLGREEVEVLAELESLETAATGFRVHPFLARVPARTGWRLAEDEIAEVVTPRLGELTDPAARRIETFSFPHWPEPRAVVCVDLEGRHLLWGLTLRLLDSLLPRLVAGEWAI